MTGAVAATAAWWEPGTRHAYHTNTYGHLVGEIVRRCTGDMPGDRLRALAASLDADVWCGVPASEQHRCADVLWAPAHEIGTANFGKLSGHQLMVMLGYFNPPGYSSKDVVNTPEWRGAQVPSTNGHGSANGVARIYAALLERGDCCRPTCWLKPPARSPSATARCSQKRPYLVSGDVSIKCPPTQRRDIAGSR